MYIQFLPLNLHFFPRNGGRPDILDIALVKGIQITDGPYAIIALESDHIPVCLCIHHLQSLDSYQLPLIYTTDWDNYTAMLARTTDCNMPLNSPDDINNAVDLITANFKSALFLTTRATRKVSDRLEPTPEDLRTYILILMKRWARRKWQQTRNPQFKTIWNNLKKRIRKRLQRQVSHFWSNKLQTLTQPNHEFWALTKSLTKLDGTKSNRPLHGTRGLVYNNLDKAEVFAEQLQIQFSLNPEPYDEDTIHLVHQHLNNLQLNLPFDPASLITPREVQRTIRKMRGRSAAGPDKISAMALKHIPRKMLVLLTRIFNAMLQQSHFPPQWKIAKVIMIPKVGKDPLYPQNHRPISLLSVISKLFERLLKTRLYNFVQDHNLFPSHQFGFRPQFDTVAQLVRTVEEITLQFNRRSHIFGIFLDTSKAFDKVWHQGLLYKLHIQGISAPIYSDY